MLFSHLFSISRLSFRRSLVFFFGGLAALAVLASQWTRGLPVYGQVPEFSLIDQGGRAVNREDFTGQVWVANFIFTNCAATCPMMTSRFSQLKTDLGESPVRLVSITVDPRRDTPKVLAKYGGQFGAPSDRWSFLTGPKGDIYRLCKDGFKLSVSDEGAEPLHSTKFVLVDRRGRIRGYYDGLEEESVEKLRRDIQTL